MQDTLLELHIITKQSQFESLCNNHEMKRIRELCKNLSDPSVKEGKLYGFCAVCKKNVDFSYDWQYSDEKRQMINFRERLICPACGLNNRQRAMIDVLMQNINKATKFSNRNKSSIMKLIGEKISNKLTVKTLTRKIYLYEFVSPFYSVVANNLEADIEVIGSEFLGFDIKSGTTVNGIRHEDALNMSFSDNSLDAIVSNDVFEHVPDINVAFSEAYRILGHGGKLIFSVPFIFADKTVKRAEVINGELKHLEEPTYHGNPVSSDGSLVFYDFGWDMLDMCKNAGFTNVYMIAYFSEYLGNLCESPLFVFVAEKL